MKVLIACEYSGRVREAFRAMGHDAWSCDLFEPIILDEDGEIMDGRHRIMKCMWKGIPTIKAVRFDENPSPCRVDEA